MAKLNNRRLALVAFVLVICAVLGAGYAYYPIVPIKKSLVVGSYTVPSDFATHSGAGYTYKYPTSAQFKASSSDTAALIFLGGKDQSGERQFVLTSKTQGGLKPLSVQTDPLYYRDEVGPRYVRVLSSRQVTIAGHEGRQLEYVYTPSLKDRFFNLYGINTEIKIDDSTGVSFTFQDQEPGMHYKDGSLQKAVDEYGEIINSLEFK